MVFIGSTIQAKKHVVEQQVCTLFKRCLKKETGHPIFDDYFTVLSHGKRTRNNYCLKFPSIKLEASRSKFFFGAAKIFNKLPVSEREFLK